MKNMLFRVLMHEMQAIKKAFWAKIWQERNALAYRIAVYYNKVFFAGFEIWTYRSVSK